MTPDDVLAVMSEKPCKVGDLGLLLVGAVDAEGQAIGAFLASRGLSLSALQKLVDELVRDGRARELRGRELWESYHEGLEPNAKGRYFTRA